MLIKEYGLTWPPSRVDDIAAPPREGGSMSTVFRAAGITLFVWFFMFLGWHILRGYQSGNETIMAIAEDFTRTIGGSSSFRSFSRTELFSQSCEKRT
jgi:hypothetical protein